MNDEYMEMIKDGMQRSLEQLQSWFEKAENNGYVNEQWFINILDKLNEMSVKY